jgi:hypothetical protein
MGPGKKSTAQVSQGAAPQTGDSPKFQYIPIDSVVASSRVRSGINIESDCFKALMESIKARGILSFIQVRLPDRKYDADEMR